MAVLVIGGAGYIGSHMVLALADRGEQVVVLDDLSTGFAWALHPAARLVVGDMGHASLLDSIIKNHGIDAIVHFAARIVVPDSVADPLGYYEANTVKTRGVIAAAVRNGVKNFIFSSTAAVYGTPATDTVDERASVAPESPYGASKLMTEWMLRDAGRAHPLSYVILRYFNVCGADPGGRSGQSTRNATHLIKVACEAALGSRAGMQIFGTDYPTPDGTCLRDYIHVSDLIAAHVAALDHLRRGGASDLFNCGYGRGYSVRAVIDTVKAVSGVDFPVAIAPRRPGDATAIVADSAKIRSALGWAPAHDDLTHIVDTALSWERRLMRPNQPR